MGLPNITGLFNYGQIDGGGGFGASGAFTATRLNTGTGYGNNRFGCPQISFNASRSSTVYGSSSTVTPLSLTTKLILKY